MSRPKLTERVTIRLPEELLADCAAHAERRSLSLNEVILCALENEFARLLTYRIPYYDLRRLTLGHQGDSVRQLF